MDNGKEHAELMTRIAVFEATVNGKFDSIINHLASLNGQTSKNTQAIQTLKDDDKDIRTMFYDHSNKERLQEQHEEERQDMRDKKQDGWKKRWQDLLFGTLQWIIPALIVGTLLNGRAILEFLNLVH